MASEFRKNPNYILKRIVSEDYLVPFGQAIETGARAVRVSEAAAFLWEALDECPDVPGLAERLAAEYELGPDEAEGLAADVETLMQSLVKAGVVGEGAPENETPEAVSCIRTVKELPDGACGEYERFVEIAGLLIRFRGKEEHFSANFGPFCVPGSLREADIEVRVTEEDPPGQKNLPFVLRGMTVTVQDGGDTYIMRSTETPALKEAHIKKDGSLAVFYVEKEGSGPWFGEAGEAVTAADCVFHAMRHAFLIKAESRDMYVIHSASILHEGRAWLFSALSGTGKSTHTNIWHRLYGTPYLDGDLNLLAFEDGKPVVKGIPWCGTSGIFTTGTYPLGGILLLARSPKNHVEEMKEEAQVLGISMRFISPKWTAEQAAESLDFAERIAKTARIARLRCNMEDEAAEVCRAWIDGKNEAG